MFGIGAGEFVLILIVGLIVFGPNKLPEIGRSLGKLIREFRKAQSALSTTLAEVDISSTAPPKTDTSNQNNSANPSTNQINQNNQNNQMNQTNQTNQTNQANQMTSDNSNAAKISTSADSETTKSPTIPPTIEEVTEMIKSNPIRVPSSQIDLSKQTADNKV